MNPAYMRMLQESAVGVLIAAVTILVPTALAALAKACQKLIGRMDRR